MAVSSSADFIDDRGFQIDKDGPGDVFAGSSFGEKGVERVVATANGLVGRHLSIGLDSMLQTVEFPTGIADLAAGLADMNGDTFTLKKLKKK